MSIEENLDFDISSALAGVDQLEAALTAAASSAADALSSAIETAIADLNAVITPEVDPQLIIPGIDDAIAAATSEVVVTADASDVTTAIDDAVAAADTGALEEKLSGVGKGAHEGADGLERFERSVVGLEVAAGLSAGNTRQLGSALAAIGPEGVAIAAGTIAAAEGIHRLVEAGIELDTVQRRANLVLGEFREDVENIKVGNLDTTLKDLAHDLGATDTALLNATISAFSFANASGLAGKDAAEFANQVDALAARIVARNPALALEDVAARLPRALGGNARALLSFGISVDQAAVNARALSLGLVDVDGNVTRIGKAVATAQILTEKFGDSLKQDVAAGSEAAVIQLRRVKAELTEKAERLGATLLDDFIKLVKAGEPVIASFSAAMGKLGEATLPLVGAGTVLVVDVLKPLLDLFTAIPTELLQTALVTFTAAKALGALATGFEIVALNARFATTALGQEAIAEAAVGLAALVNPVTIAAVAVGALTAVFLHNREEQRKTKDAVDALSQSFSDQAKSVREDVGAQIGKQFKDLSPILNKAKLSFTDVQKAVEGGKDSFAALTTQLDALEQAGVITSDEEIKLFTAIGTLAENADAAAAATIAAAQAGKTYTAEQIAAAEGVNHNADGTTNYVAALIALQALLPGTASGITDVAGALDSVDAKAAAEELKSFTDSIVSAADGVQAGLAKFKEGQGLKTFVDNIATEVERSHKFVTALQTLVARGAGTLASLLAQQGPAALLVAEQAANAKDSILRAREAQVEGLDALRNADTAALTALGPKLKKAVDDPLARAIAAAEQTAHQGNVIGTTLIQSIIGGVAAQAPGLRSAVLGAVQAAINAGKAAAANIPIPELIPKTEAENSDHFSRVAGAAGAGAGALAASNFNDAFFKGTDQKDHPLPDTKAAGKAADDLKALAKSLSDAFQAATATGRALDTIGPAKLAAILAEFRRGEVTLARFNEMLKQTGLNSDSLLDVLNETRDGMKQFVDDSVSGLASLEDAIGSVKENEGLSEFLLSIRQNTVKTAQFLKDVQTLAARGADDLARAFLEAGIDSGTAARQAAGLTAATLTARERQLEALQSADVRNTALGGNVAQGLAGGLPAVAVRGAGQTTIVNGGNSQINNITVNEIAGDPAATAAAVSNRLAAAAKP